MNVRYQHTRSTYPVLGHTMAIQFIENNTQTGHNLDGSMRLNFSKWETDPNTSIATKTNKNGHHRLN